MNIATLPQALERIAVLEEEKAALESKLGFTSDANALSRIRQRWGLTPREAQLVLLLANRSGLATSKDLILDALYRGAADEPEMKIVDVFVCKIRAKMGQPAIETIWGSGYRIGHAALAEVQKVIASRDFDIRPAARPDKSQKPRHTLQAEVLALIASKGPLTSHDIRLQWPTRISTASIASTISAARKSGRAKIVDWKLHKDGYKRTVYDITDRGRGYVRERLGDL